MDVSTLHDFDNNEEDEADLLNKLMELRKENAKALQEILDLEKTMTIWMNKIKQWFHYQKKTELSLYFLRKLRDKINKSYKEWEDETNKNVGK